MSGRLIRGTRTSATSSMGNTSGRERGGNKPFGSGDQRANKVGGHRGKEWREDCTTWHRHWSWDARTRGSGRLWSGRSHLAWGRDGLRLGHFHTHLVSNHSTRLGLGLGLGLGTSHSALGGSGSGGGGRMGLRRSGSGKGKRRRRWLHGTRRLPDSLDVLGFRLELPRSSSFRGSES